MDKVKEAVQEAISLVMLIPRSGWFYIKVLDTGWTSDPMPLHAARSYRKIYTVEKALNILGVTPQMVDFEESVEDNVIRIMNAS